MDTFINNQEFNGDEEDEDSIGDQMLKARNSMQISNSHLKTNGNQIMDADNLDDDEYALMRLQE